MYKSSKPPAVIKQPTWEKDLDESCDRDKEIEISFEDKIEEESDNDPVKHIDISVASQSPSEDLNSVDESDTSYEPYKQMSSSSFKPMN